MLLEAALNLVTLTVVREARIGPTSAKRSSIHRLIGNVRSENLHAQHLSLGFMKRQAKNHGQLPKRRLSRSTICRWDSVVAGPQCCSLCYWQPRYYRCRQESRHMRRRRRCEMATRSGGRGILLTTLRRQGTRSASARAQRTFGIFWSAARLDTIHCCTVSSASSTLRHSRRGPSQGFLQRPRCELRERHSVVDRQQRADARVR